MFFVDRALIPIHPSIIVLIPFEKNKMYIGDINLFIIVFVLILSSICINVSSALHLLLTAEILWITLYFITLSIGIVYDNLNLMSLTFFFLVLSAVEFGIGLVILLVQNVFFRSLSLLDSNSDFIKNSTRFTSRVKSNYLPFI